MDAHLRDATVTVSVLNHVWKVTKPKVSVIGTATAADCSLCSVNECPHAAPLLFTVLLSKPPGNRDTGRCRPGSENFLTKGNLTTQQVRKSGRSQSYINKTNDLDICRCSSALSKSSSLVAALSNTKMTEADIRARDPTWNGHEKLP